MSGRMKKERGKTKDNAVILNFRFKPTYPGIHSPYLPFQTTENELQSTETGSKPPSFNFTKRI